jgi:PAS domain-containing protein
MMFLFLLTFKKDFLPEIYCMPCIRNRNNSQPPTRRCLSMPVFITDTKGNLIFYNEPAEQLLGSRFEDAGEMKVETWSKGFQTAG